jgi:hypothetical protein
MQVQAFIDYYKSSTRQSSSTAYHDDVAEEVRSDSSYTNHTKCYYHYKAGMAHILAMLYRLMDRRGHGHADATPFYINTTCMET